MTESEDLTVAHEMTLTADLLRHAIAQHPRLQPQSNGQRLLLSYAPEKIWLSAGGITVAELQKSRWWEAGLSTREDRAANLADLLARTIPCHL